MTQLNGQGQPLSNIHCKRSRKDKPAHSNHVAKFELSIVFQIDDWKRQSLNHNINTEEKAEIPEETEVVRWSVTGVQ